MIEQGLVIWITGLSGAGKTTLAKSLYMQLPGPKLLLDGDDIRQVLKPLVPEGYDPESRRKLGLVYCRLCRMGAEQGLTVICSAIGMLHELRDWNRANIPNYFEVYLEASLEGCMAKDSRGVYARGIDNKEFVVGLNMAPELPNSPDIKFAAHSLDADSMAAKIVQRLRESSLTGYGRIPVVATNKQEGETMYKYRKIFSYRDEARSDAIEEQQHADTVLYFEKYKNDLRPGPCPICGSEKSDAVEAFHNTFAVAKCRACASLFVNPRPTPEMLNDYYNNAKCHTMLADFYRQRSGDRSAILDSRCVMVVNQILQMKKPLVTVTDIGCNNGSFLRNLKDHMAASHPEIQVKYIGIDIDATVIELARNHNPDIEFVCGAAERFASDNARKIDIVTMWQLLEHILDPKAFIISLRKGLVPGGKILLTTPNASGLEKAALDYNTKRRQLAHPIFPLMHLNAFSTDNIKLFSYCCGMEMESFWTNGVFDVDILTVNKEELRNPVFRDLADLGEDVKAFIQTLLRELNATGAMSVILREPSK